ncbi:MAG: hypothetical protein SFZ03_01645 [Candidatus Melainabacteria bacterium]|nr:hypothetical protein [Candidatus Melainabacteria bacterium]
MQTIRLFGQSSVSQQVQSQRSAQVLQPAVAPAAFLGQSTGFEPAPTIQLQPTADAFVRFGACVNQQTKLTGFEILAGQGDIATAWHALEEAAEINTQAATTFLLGFLLGKKFKGGEDAFDKLLKENPAQLFASSNFEKDDAITRHMKNPGSFALALEALKKHLKANHLSAEQKKTILETLKELRKNKQEYPWMKDKKNQDKLDEVIEALEKGQVEKMKDDLHAVLHQIGHEHGHGHHHHHHGA